MTRSCPRCRGTGTLEEPAKDAPRKRIQSAATKLRGRPHVIPAAVRAEVAERAGGVCEACGAYGVHHMHHRKMRSQGGRDEAVNLVHIHSRCHDYIHANPELSYSVGLLVRRWADPAEIAVRLVEWSE